MRNYIFPQKKAFFIEIIWRVCCIYLNLGLLNLYHGKKITLGNNYWIINFWLRFLFYFFIFFSKKFFFQFWDIRKCNCRFWSAVNRLPIRVCHQISANSSNGGPGGRLAPRLPDLITFVAQKLGHSYYYRLCMLGIPTSGRSGNLLSLETRKTIPKKLKSHNFVIGTYIFPPRLFRFFSLRDISAVLSATMSIFSATCSGLSRRSVRLSCLI